MSEFRDHPEKFDLDWLAARLDQPVGTLHDMDFVPVGTGQVGDSYRLSLKWSTAVPGAPATIIAKCPAQDPVSRETGGDLHLPVLLFYSCVTPLIRLAPLRCLLFFYDFCNHFLL